MGCNSSTGSKKDDPKSIKFETVGVHSMDEFFRQCTELLNNLTGVLEPLEESREKFMKATNFNYVPGCSKNSITDFFRG